MHTFYVILINNKRNDITFQKKKNVCVSTENGIICPYSNANSKHSVAFN